MGSNRIKAALSCRTFIIGVGLGGFWNMWLERFSIGFDETIALTPWVGPLGYAMNGILISTGDRLCETFGAPVMVGFHRKDNRTQLIIHPLSPSTFFNNSHSFFARNYLQKCLALC